MTEEAPRIESSWTPAPVPERRPRGDEIDVWAIDLAPSAGRLRELRALLDAEEITRAERFHFERHRRRFIVRRGAMRILLSAYLGRRADDLRFTLGTSGKPDLADPPAGARLAFNLTDSEDFALLAVGEGAELGVDVEALERPRDADRLVERFFSEPEREVYAGLPDDLKTAGFFRAWTCKEAYLKAIGTGLQTPLRDSTVELDPRRPSRMIEVAGSASEAARWSLRELRPRRGFAGALARRQRLGALRLFRWA
ncbi:MAG: 4'-phosphopantetheinyl transferase superfamily protein [Acidobacteriota bacterium]